MIWASDLSRVLTREVMNLPDYSGLMFHDMFSNKTLRENDSNTFMVKKSLNVVVYPVSNLGIYLFNRFHRDKNAKMRLEKEIHFNKSQKLETKVRDTQQSEAPN